MFESCCLSGRKCVDHKNIRVEKLSLFKETTFLEWTQRRGVWSRRRRSLSTSAFLDKRRRSRWRRCCRALLFDLSTILEWYRLSLVLLFGRQMAARHFIQDKHETALNVWEVRICFVDKVPPIALGTMRKIHPFSTCTTCQTSTNILEHSLKVIVSVPKQCVKSFKRNVANTLFDIDIQETAVIWRTPKVGERRRWRDVSRDNYGRVLLGGHGEIGGTLEKWEAPKANTHKNQAILAAKRLAFWPCPSFIPLRNTSTASLLMGVLFADISFGRNSTTCLKVN